jgi:hypothetical protein
MVKVQSSERIVLLENSRTNIEPTVKLLKTLTPLASYHPAVIYDYMEPLFPSSENKAQGRILYIEDMRENVWGTTAYSHLVLCRGMLQQGLFGSGSL